MYLHTYNQPASKNAKQLSDQLVEVVRAAKKSNKNLSYVDVCQATRLTIHEMREELGGMAVRLQLLIAFGIVFLMMTAAVVVATLYL